jgi:hypothetical protein
MTSIRGAEGGGRTAIEGPARGHGNALAPPQNFPYTLRSGPLVRVVGCVDLPCHRVGPKQRPAVAKWLLREWLSIQFTI